MNLRPATIRYPFLAGILALMWPLLGFAAPPMGAGPDGDDPHMMMGCHMPPGGEHGHHFGRFAGGEHGGWDMHPRLLMGLKLSEEQEDKVFTILHSVAPAMRDQMKALRKAHEGLRGLPTSAQYDDAHAKALSDAAGKAMGQLAYLRTRTEHEIYAVLTPEQRTQVTEREHKWESHKHDGAPHQ